MPAFQLCKSYLPWPVNGVSVFAPSTSPSTSPFPSQRAKKNKVLLVFRRNVNRIKKHSATSEKPTLVEPE